MRYDYKNGEKLTRFSIRKYHFGAASVAVASLIFFGGGMSAKAENVSVSHDTQNNGNATNGDKNAGGDSGKQATADNKPITVDVPAVTLPTEKVDKTKLNTLTVSLKTTVMTTGEEKISSILEELKKVIADADKLLNNDNATAEEVNKQIDELTKAKKKLEDTVAEADKKAAEQKKAEEAKKAQESATDRSATTEASNREVSVESPTPKKRGKKGRTTEVQPADSESATPKVEAATSNKETAPKALPTYTNGTDNYKLADEMRNIVTYLRKNGADETKVAAIKANYDKLNEKLGLADENGVLSEADFATATANLKAARDTIESFLDSKSSVPGTERSGEPGLNRQSREAGKSFADSNEYYYEDGSTSSSSHYSKYTYLHHSMRLVGIADWNDQKISDARKYFYANVTPTQDGFLWEITVNSGHFDNYLTSSLWITTPDTQQVVANSIKVTKFGRDGQRLDTYDGAASTIEEQLRRAGLGRVTLGKVSETNVRRGGAGAAAYRTNNLEDLARESFDKSGGGEGVGEIGFYRRWREFGSQQNRANEKFNMINGSNSNLHYFELPENRDGSSFVISFKTRGNNNPQKLVYSGGLKAIRMSGAEQRRTLVNQMYAQTPTERDYTDQYPIHVVGNGTFFVKQGTYYHTGYDKGTHITGNVWGGHEYDYSPFRADGILGTASPGVRANNFDLNQYTAPPGVNTPSANYNANAAGQTWEYYDADGKKLSARDIGEHGADKPGLVEYLLKRTFTKDGSQDNYKIRFVVKPKQPTFVGDLGFVGEKTSGLRAENGTKDIPITLYRKVDGVEKPIEVKTVKADANGVANFGEVTIEEGTYYVQTSMTTDQYVDYNGNTHNKVESDKSARQLTAIVPPKVKVQNTELSATTAKENAPVLYEVIQGQRFNPHVEAWDDKGNLNKFTIANLPQGVTANPNFRATNNATKQNTTDAVFSGNVPELQTVGEHIATVTVADESNKEKQYYFKYRVIEKDRIAPTVKIVDKTKNNTETTLTDNVSNAPTIDVYRGANIELPLKYYDNDRAGKVNIQYVSGLPSGVSFNQNASVTIKESDKTENAQGGYTVRGHVDANASLGITTVTLKVSDAANGDVNQGNKKEVKFRVRVLDLDFEQGVSEQAGAAKISREVELNRPVGDPNNYLTVNDGSQRNDRLFPSGMTFRFIRGTEYKTDLTYTDPGKYTVKAAAFYPTTYVPTNGESVVAANATATGDNISEIRGRAYVAREIEFQVKPTAPTVTPQENGDVVVAHTNQRNVKTLSFTYTNGSGAQQTVTATKNGNSWTLDNPSIDGVTIDANTGAVTIKDRAVGDASQVTAKVATSDSVNSNDTTATAKTGERIAPTFEFNSKYTEVVNGQRVVYVTPTENLSNGSITLGTVKDNSGKLLETVLFHGNGSSYNLEYGLTYNDKPRTTNGDFNAPHDIVIKGTVPKINPNTRSIWENNTSLVTRYVSAMDAAENQLKNQSDQNSNPLRVQFKILTQAAKYNPQVATQAINKDITANGARLSADEFNAIKPNIRFTANKGDVKVAYNTTDMNITMNENGAVKRNSNGTYYVGATVTYPDGTSETIQIPVEKSDKIPPTVKMNGKELTENAADNHFIIYRGANFNPTFEVNDNSGVTTYLKADGIPNGVWFNKQGERDFPKTENMRNGTQYQLTTNNTVDSIAPLGDHEARVTVKDALNNEKTYKFKYTIVDVDVKDSPKNVRLNSQLGDPHHFLTTTAANRVNADDKYFPGGMQFKWIKNNQEVAQTTTLPKAGNITDYKVVAEFANGATSYVKNIDGKDVTIYTPAKVGKPVTLIVTEDSPPTVKMTNPSNNQTTELSGDDSNSPIVTIYRNGQLDIPLSFYDNEATGRVNLQYVEGLPKGVTFGRTNNTVSVTGAVANSNGRHTISGRVAADATLGMSTVTMKVSDGANGVDSGNQGEVKFRIRVLDVDFEEAKSPEPNQSSITVEANVGVNVPDPNHYLTVNDGTNRTDQGNFPSGMTFRYVSSDGSSTTRTLQYNAPGQYTVKARAYFPENYAGTNGIGEVVSGQTGDNTEINGRRYIEKTIVFRVKPTTPVVAPQDNGDVVITQPNETNVNRLSVTYTRQDNSEEVTYTAAKNGDTWSFGSNVPITIDSTTGTVKIKDRLVQDGSTVKVKAITNDGILSDEATGDAKPGDAIYPTIDFQNTETDADGNRVVYITPTEATNLDVATINDNSNKLLEAVFFDQGATLTDLGNYGLTYNKVIRNGDTITNAPLTFTVRGTLNKIKSGSTLWVDNEVITTRYASAMDAAENNIRDKSGSRDNVASNPYRVVFKTLTQATKYTPTVSKSKIERDITQANTTITAAEFNKIKDTLTFSSTRGEVKVDKNTSGLTFAMKNSTVQTKQDGTLYITATVTYPDGSREDIEVPLDTTNANKAKPTLTIPEVSIKAAKAKGEQGSVPATEYNRVLNNVTVPQGQPQPTAKEVKNNGRIGVVDGKNVVTVGLTFSDNTKKDITVPVLEVKPVDITTTFNELDNTVTVKPNTTVENGDKLHVTIRGVGMQLTKTDTGYTNSRNDRDITVNSDGSITISLLGNETFQAGDRVVTRHESNKNGKVDSYETEAFAGLKPVEKVPAINLTNLTPKEIEDVKAAVKKANPSVNVDELQVAPNGDVTYTHRGEGVGENDPAQTFTLRDNVRERNDAEKIDPTVTPLTRHDQAPKHTEAQVTGAVTGEKITGKRVVGEIPDGTGEATVEVTYEDGSKENVKVQITVTPSDATTVTPTVTPLTRHDQAPKHTEAQVTGAVTGEKITGKRVVGEIPDGTGEATVEVTYEDGSKENVKVQITVTPSDATTVTPTVTPLTRHDQAPKHTEAQVTGAVTGEKITGKRVVGEIPDGTGEATVEVTYEDGSKENVKVQITVTPSDATTVTPTVTPLTRHDQAPKHTEAQVTGAVTGEKITGKRVVGEIPDGTGEATVEVTYEDGSKENVKVQITVTPSDATTVTPTVTPLTRHDQAPKHTEAQVTGAVTGEKITGKRVVGEIPDGTGEATVEVTYEDGSKENVKVQITVTPSDATTVTPTVTPLTRHDQAPKHTEAQVTGAVTGEKITGKRVVGEIPDGTGEATVEVTYEDGSKENVKVQITVTPSDATTVTPTVTPLTRHDQAPKHTEAQVTGAVTGEKITGKRVVGEIPDGTGEATVEVTYEDGSKENVKVQITVTPSDATTVTPTVTPLTRHDQAPKHTEAQVTGAVTGEKITGKRVVGEIPDGTGEATVEVTYEDGSKENVKVQITVTPSDATTVTPTVTPLTRHDQAPKHTEAQVTGAVTGEKITGKRVVGEIPDGTGEATVEVTYEDGSKENVKVQITVTPSDATTVTPTVTPLTRHDQAPKHTEAQVTGAVTGEKITGKRVVGEIPDGTGEATVEVTYEDGSKENVKVQITVTPSDATTVTPTVTPLTRHDQAPKHTEAQVTGAVTGEKITGKRVVGEIPDGTGEATVEVTYEDGSKENVKVQITVTPSDATTVTPTVTPLTRHDQAPKHTEAQVTGAVTGEKITGKRVVGEIPDGTGEATVEVTYEDGSKENVKVQITVTPSDATTVTPTVTPLTRHDQAPKHTEAQVTGAVTGEKITGKRVVGEIPDGTGEATVEVTYEDGSKENVKVQITVTPSDATTVTPTVTPLTRHDQAPKHTEAQVTGAVTGEKITGKRVVGEIPDGTGEATVEVTYEDGSKENVKVQITVTPSDATTVTPTVTPLTRHDQAPKHTEAQVTGAVTGEKITGKRVVGEIPDGTGEATVEVTYEDGSKENVKVQITVTPSDATTVTPTVTPLTRHDQAPKHTEAQVTGAVTGEKITGKRVVGEIPDGTGEATVEVTYEDGSKENVKVQITVTPSDATTVTPTVTPLTRHDQAPKHTEAQVTGAVTGEKITGKRVVGEIPDGTGEATVEVTYEDGSKENVKVQITVTPSDATTVTPTVTPLTRHDQAPKHTEAQVTGAVTGEKITGKRVVGEIPDGTGEATVEVTYEDGSKENVKVQITVTPSDATTVTPTVTPLTRHDQAPKHTEAQVTGAVTGEKITGKRVVGEIPDGTGEATVEVTYEDGSKENVKVQITVTPSDATTVTPTVTPLTRHDQAPKHTEAQVTGAVTGEKITGKRVVGEIPDGTGEATVEVTYEDGSKENVKVQITVTPSDATTVTPTVTPLTRHDQAPKHTEAQVTGAVTGEKITGKRVVGEIPDGTGEATVEVTYEDGSKENVKVQITVTPSDATTVTPTVTPLTRHDQAPKHTEAQVTGAVTGEKITGKRVVGEIPDGTGEATVEVTYEDGSKENVKVQITVTPSDATTVTPTVTPLTRHDQAPKHTEAQVTGAVTGEKITGKRVVGEIPDGTGEATVEVTYEDGSKENVKVQITVTPSDATTVTPTVTPLTRHDQAPKHTEAQVTGAVTGEKITGKRVVGEIPDGTGEATVEVTYEDGSKENVKVQITVTPSDATTVTPTVTPLTRHDQAPKHTEAQVTGAVTGEKITGKRVVGEIPDGTGEATVEVTYEDGSKENVKVQITVTPSDATTVTPTVTPLTRHDQAPKHTEAQVTGAVTGEKITGKRVVGEIPDGTGEATVEVTYEDGSKENVKVQITVTPSDATTVTPTVTPLTRHDQAPKHTEAQVTGAVTGEKITGKRVVGEIPDGTGEATVEVTYEDGSKENVKVQITVTPSDATTVTPTVTPLTRHDQAPKHTEAQVTGAVTGEKITGKRVVGEIPDGTGEATVEVTYEDGSKENVKVQITVTPSDATTVTPTVTPLTRHDQAPKHTEAQVTGAVTGEKITGKRVVGEIPDGTGEATVEVTYEDGSKENVKVQITVTPSDATTVTPTVTPLTRHDQAPKHTEAQVTGAVTGEKITGKRVVGEIPDGTGEATVEVTYEDGSKENVKVQITVTPSDATTVTPTVTPLTRHDQAPKHTEAQVTGAVTGEKITGKRVVGEIPDGTGEATVEVTYEDGSKENVKVQITVTPSDATTVTPTVTPLTRHDQAPKHTEAQVTGAVTGEKITGKRVVGEIPDGTGEATVEVTYEDGSKENVKVQITVTPSDATTVTPTVTPLTRHDQAPKHTEAQVTGAVTGEKITGKRVVGEIPDGTGEATVEVTYEDGSKENVKVQITVTPSDATTVTPTVTPLTRHDQAPKHTEAQVTGAVTGEKITGKRVVGEIPDGTGEATVEVTYEDGSKENVKVQITVTPSDATTVTPTVTPLTRHDQAPKHTEAQVTGAVTGEKITGKRVVGEIPDGTGEATVEVTYEDGSKENVKVQITVTPSDATTVTPTVTPLTRHDQAPKHTEAQVTGAVTGEKITGKRVVGEIPDGTGEATVEVTYEDGSKENVKVQITVTPSDATTVTPTVTPLTRHDQAPKHTEAQVTGAVTGEKITGKRVVGEIPDGTGEATVEVTYEDGSKENVKVQITVTPSDATTVTPTVTPLTRHDQAPKHTEAQVTGAVTGEKITGKRVVGEIPDGTGEATVEVTYEDGSKENVKVQITVTPSDATTVTPTVTPLTRHDQAPKHTEAQVTGAVTGEKITGKRVVGEIPDGTGEATVEVTYEDGSKENVKVQITVTPSDATTVTPTVTPLTRHDQAPKHTEAQVTGAVTGEKITGKRVVGEIPDGTGEATVEVTYEDGSKENVKVQITVTPSDATTVTPTVTPLTRHDQAPKHTEAQVTGAVTGEKITGKRVVGEIPDGTGEATVEVTYEDGSKENVKVQITVTPSDATTVTPTVTPLTRHDQAPKHTEAQVTGAVTGEKITGKRVVGEIPDGTGEATVEVTYEDGSKENVKVQITVTPSDATTVTPTVTPLTRHDQAPKHTEAQVTGAVTGEKITGKRVVGEIPDGTGEATVEVTYEDGSKENVKVQITVTPSDATTVTPTVTPLTRHDQAPKHTEAQVTGAVTGEKITGKRVVGEIPDGTGEATVEVTYEDGSKENVKVQITVTPSDATTVTPTVTPLTRHDQAPKHTEAQVTGAVTGEKITGKRVVGEIPDGTGEATVEVTYEDGSKENVKVQITVTPSDATTVTPTVTPLTRHDQAPKHTEAQVTGAVTGEKITGKRVVGEIPDGTGEATVEVTYEDGSKENVKVQITVTPSDATTVTPTVTPLTRHDQAPKHTEAQVTGAVTGEKITGKRVVGEIPDGTGEATVEVTYEDGSKENVKVQITVVELPKAKVPVESFGNLTKEEQDKVKESVEKANPGKTVVVEPSGKVIITDPKTNISHEISEELVTTIAPPVTDNPEFNGGVNGEPEVQPELPEFNGGVNGEPEVQPELPEFNGEVVGEQQGGGNKPQLTGKVEKVTKRLANTGEAETNTGLAGLGLAVLGSLLAVAKRRKKDEE